MSEKEPEVHRSQYAQKEGEIVLRDHEYDGIQEYDQKLPNWWLVIFISAHVFFLGYWFTYYQLGWFPTDEQKIEEAMGKIETEKVRALDELLAKLDDKTLVQWATDPARAGAGMATYQVNCTACHGGDLSAKMTLADGSSIPLPGLSLTDGEWKYGKNPMDIFKLINEGTPADNAGHNGAKMMAWGLTLPPEKVAELVAYLVSKNPKDFPSE